MDVIIKRKSLSCTTRNRPCKQTKLIPFEQQIKTSMENKLDVSHCGWIRRRNKEIGLTVRLYLANDQKLGRNVKITLSPHIASKRVATLNIII